MSKRSKREPSGQQLAAFPSGELLASADGLQPRQAVALNALLKGRNQTEAAREAGLSRQRVNYLLHADTTFRTVYKAELLKLRTQIRNSIATGLLKAVQVLAQVAVDTRSAARDRVRAAVAITDLATRQRVMESIPQLDRNERLSVVRFALLGQEEELTEQEQAAADAASAFDDTKAGKKRLRLLNTISSLSKEVETLDEAVDELERSCQNHEGSEKVDGLGAELRLLQGKLDRTREKLRTAEQDEAALDRQRDLAIESTGMGSQAAIHFEWLHELSDNFDPILP